MNVAASVMGTHIYQVMYLMGFDLIICKLECNPTKLWDGTFVIIHPYCKGKDTLA